MAGRTKACYQLWPWGVTETHHSKIQGRRNTTYSETGVKTYDHKYEIEYMHKHKALGNA